MQICIDLSRQVEFTKKFNCFMDQEFWMVGINYMLSYT